jgi:hypothetical protein
MRCVPQLQELHHWGQHRTRQVEKRKPREAASLPTMQGYQIRKVLAVRRYSFVVMAGMFLLTLACDETPGSVSNSTPKAQPEQDLTITFGGFLQNGPQDELLDGQCSRNATRDVLQCDIHNGFAKWNITEITFQVIRGSDPETERHYYRERTSIASLQTETIAIKLGMQLPADTYFKRRNGGVDTFTHWSWLIVGAKGQPIK